MQALDNVREWNLEQRNEGVRGRTKSIMWVIWRKWIKLIDMYNGIAYIVSCSS